MTAPASTPAASAPVRYTPPIFFLFMELPFGAAVGFLQIAVPYWMAKKWGIGLAEISTLSGTAFLPHALKVAWVPLLDVGNHRRTWYLACVVATAALLAACAIVPDPAHHLGLLTLLLTACQATAATSASALNALMALTSREEDKSRVGGYQMAGNVGGTALLGTLPLWLESHSLSPTASGLIQAGLVLACGAVGLFVVEPRNAAALAAAAKRSGLADVFTKTRLQLAAVGATVGYLLAAWDFGSVKEMAEKATLLSMQVGADTVVAMASPRQALTGVVGGALFGFLLGGDVGKELWATIRTRTGWTGLVICFAPVGCGALTNLFSAMAGAYSVEEHTVQLVNGLYGGVISAAGSIAGGFLADRMNRRLAYCICGGLTALTAFAMAFSPMTSATYQWGVLAYSFANGMAFAAFAGMVLEMMTGDTAVTTKYALFVAVSNQAISYVTWLDGHASDFIVRGQKWGTVGTVTFDGLITVGGIVLVGVLAMLLRRTKEETPPAPAIAA